MLQNGFRTLDTSEVFWLTVNDKYNSVSPSESEAMTSVPLMRFPFHNSNPTILAAHHRGIIILWTQGHAIQHSCAASDIHYLWCHGAKLYNFEDFRQDIRKPALPWWCNTNWANFWSSVMQRVCRGAGDLPILWISPDSWFSTGFTFSHG